MVADCSTQRRVRHLPGEEGIWVFITGDLLVFSLLFGLFLDDRSHNVALFEQSRAILGRGFGLFNTLVLLTSSLFVALAVNKARQELRKQAATLLACAIVCGFAFGASKVTEYSSKISHGITPQTNDFFMYYFMLTGIHMFHVIIATVVLFFLWGRTRSTKPDPNYISVMETGAVFWHMVDLLWVILFALLYLLP
jgi:nitric oxide reductase NorE protein